MTDNLSMIGLYAVQMLEADDRVYRIDRVDKDDDFHRMSSSDGRVRLASIVNLADDELWALFDAEERAKAFCQSANEEEE